ncbi:MULTISPECIES: GAD-like domain-containing protein [unclassified Phyllobacterium]|uniref:GAD-like domain-containing protein n=1 Tax=unclassified Phyllobacterium TaxID=2638441 RepID=UPI003012D1E8
MVLNNHFQYIVDRFGRPEGLASLPTDADLAAYRDITPPSLLEFWKECGYGIVLDGYFQFCNPTAYQPVVDQIFEGDKEFDPKLICPIGFSAFGKLLLWHKDFYTIDLDLVDLRMSCVGFIKKSATKEDSDLTIVSVLMNLDDNSYDKYGEDSKPLFKRALSKLSRLPPDSIYGFKPALALGGSRTVDSLAVYSAFEHMSLLSQLGDIKLIDYSNPAL